ncbi:1-phosphofructokinase [Sporanaerobium hydrogeniformans]|uniref:1-phosphofructokinase n=1 Tax=Sporanaerobium hydrogeniformans TaxID=3072179 RepID=A0AC61DCD4_9FIRM|nr:hexose kinase [Sporanaerobium hydrogeniformans]PHV70683.1 1-phosphofructokinase [Sporanaerobium hydrogeniformans]
MRKIICVTLNPAMDHTVCIDGYNEGHVNAIKEHFYEVGGKGINVAKVLKNFKIDSIVTGFVGSNFPDTFRTKLMKRGIETKFFKLLQNTRINIKLIDMQKGSCTTFKEEGPFVPEELLERFINSFSLMCHPGDYVILTGAIPTGIPSDIYVLLTQLAKEKGATVLLDCEGQLLKKNLFAQPDILKLNYRSLVPQKRWGDLTKEDLPSLVKWIKSHYEGKALISLGQLGALWITPQETYYAEAIELGIKLKYPVGAGDAMVAALVMSQIEEFNDVTTLKYAIACATACVAKKDPCSCTPAEVNELLSQVVIQSFILD